MTTIADVSGKLGEYMLKGWVIFLFDLVPVTRADHYTRQVLTDDSCPNSGRPREAPYKVSVKIAPFRARKW